MIDPTSLWTWVQNNIVAASGGAVAFIVLVSSAVHNWYVRSYLSRIAIALEGLKK